MSFLMALVVLLLVAGGGAAAGEDKPDPRFGVSEAFWAPDDSREIGVGWERILFYWKEIQPGGPEDWNTLHVLEEWLVEAEQSGREVVGLLKNTPNWASEDGTEAGLPRGLYLEPDDPDNYWANYTRRIARYYRSRGIHHWIIWNEPEISADTYGFEFAGSIEDYYQLLKVAYKVMKEEDPQAVIHLAGVTWWHDPTYLSRLFDIMAQDTEAESTDWFFDVVSLHIYFRPETVLTIVQEIKSLLEEHGLDKEIWVNETNAPPNKDPLWPVDRPAFDVDLEQQAWFLLQASSLAFTAGADRLAVYKLVDVFLPDGGESFGLVRQDGSQRPAFEAYETVIDYLGFFEESTLKIHPHYYVATFKGPGRLVRAAWARGLQPVTLMVPSVASQAIMVNYLGDTTMVNSEDEHYLLSLDPAVCHQECLIGGPPLLLVEEYIGESAGEVGTSVAISGITPSPVSYMTATRYASATPTPTRTIMPSPTSSGTNTPAPTATTEMEVSSTPYPAATPTIADGITAVTEGDSEIVSIVPGSPASPLEIEEPSDAASDVGESEGGTQTGLYFIAAALLLGAVTLAYWLRRGISDSG